MQLIDKNGVFEYWDTPRYENCLQIICISSGFNLFILYHQIGKTTWNKVTAIIRLQQRTSILIKIQESLLFEKCPRSFIGF